MWCRVVSVLVPALLGINVWLRTRYVACLDRHVEKRGPSNSGTSFSDETGVSAGGGDDLVGRLCGAAC